LLNVAATTTESANGSALTSTSSIPIHIDPVATAPTLDLHAVSGSAGAPIQLNIGAGLVDTDGSETLSVLLRGLPDGAALSTGLHNADGSWVITPDHLANLTVAPPSGAHGDFTLAVSAVAHQSLSGLDAVTTGSMHLVIRDPVTVAAASTGIYTSVDPVPIDPLHPTAHG
jgi:hypothetical protein